MFMNLIRPGPISPHFASIRCSCIWMSLRGTRDGVHRSAKMSTKSTLPLHKGYWKDIERLMLTALSFNGNYAIISGVIPHFIGFREQFFFIIRTMS